MKKLILAFSLLVLFGCSDEGAPSAPARYIINLEEQSVLPGRQFVQLSGGVKPNIFYCPQKTSLVVVPPEFRFSIAESEDGSSSIAISPLTPFTERENVSLFISCAGEFYSLTAVVDPYVRTKPIRLSNIH